MGLSLGPLGDSESIERVGNFVGPFQVAKELGLPVMPLSPGGRDKVIRANALAAHGANGRLWWPPEAGWLRNVKSELLAFPSRDVHDDTVDALVYAPQLAYDQSYLPAYTSRAVQNTRLRDPAGFLTKQSRSTS